LKAVTRKEGCWKKDIGEAMVPKTVGSAIEEEEEERGEEDEKKEKKGKEEFRRITRCCMCCHERPLL